MPIRNFRVGGLATDTPSDIITLFAHFTQGTGWSVFRKMPIAESNYLTLGQGYAVTAGKNLYIAKVIFSGTNTNNNTLNIALGHVDNDFGIDQASPTRTNPFMLAGRTSVGGQGFVGGGTYDTSTAQVMDVVGSHVLLGPIPAGKYVMALVNGLSTTGVGITLQAIEV